MASAPPFSTGQYPSNQPPPYTQQPKNDEYPNGTNYYTNPPYNPSGQGYQTNQQGPPPSLPPPSAIGMMRGHRPDDLMDDSEVDNFSDKSIRRAFIRKVYMIVTTQLAFTLTFVIIFSLVDPVKVFVIGHRWIYYVAYGVFIVTYLVLVCVKKVRRTVPWNYICLTIFTAAFTYVTAMISAYHKTYIVVIALGITVVVCVGVTIFAIQTKIDFTVCSGVLFVCSMVVMLFGIAVMLVFAFANPDERTQKILQCVYGAITALLFSAYLIFDTQMLMGDKKNRISEEEYVYAALQLYMDMVQIFMAIMQFAGAIDR